MSKKIKGRKAVIEAATQAVMTDRNADYAPPEENFRRIADLWNVYLEGRSEITPYDTAIMMVLVKVARIQASPHLADHLVDIAGYAACAGDVMPAAPKVQVEEREPVDEQLTVLSREEQVAAEGVPATYEGAEGLYLSEGDGGTFYGKAGRKVGVVHTQGAVKAGVLVLS